MAVPYTFATQSGNVPLSQLDANFAYIESQFPSSGFAAAGANNDITALNALTTVPTVVNSAISAHGMQVNGQILYTGNVTLGSSDAGALVMLNGAFTVTFPTTNPGMGQTFALNNIGTGNITLAFSVGTDFRTTLYPGETVVLSGNGGGYWRMVATGNVGLGYGQTWQSVVGSRALGTTYFNTTGRPIVVYAWNNLGNSGGNTLIISGVSFPSNYVSSSNQTWICEGIVPVGGSYAIIMTNGGPAGWLELR